MHRIFIISSAMAVWCLYSTSVWAYWNGQPADVVVGQNSMNQNLSNRGGNPDATTLSYPTGVCAVNGKLFVADTKNFRLLIYTGIPTTSGAAASVVVGQASFTAHSQNQGLGYAQAHANTLSYLEGVDCDGTRLYISDFVNHRVLIYNSLPGGNNRSANVAAGQLTLDGNRSNRNNDDRYPWQNTLCYPEDVCTDGVRLYIADTHNCRVMIYDRIPTENDYGTWVAVGQENVFHNLANKGHSPDSRTLNEPNGLCVSGTKLFVADTNNNRVLIYNHIPTAANASADVVVGQSEMGGVLANQGGGPAPDTLYKPNKVYCDGTRLFIADQFNNRVLVYNTIPTHNGAWADVVIGQPNMYSNTANYGGISGNTLNQPEGVYSNGTQLFISDSGNNRVLIYANSTEPTPTFTATQSATMTITPTATLTETISSSHTITPSFTASPTATLTLTPSPLIIASATPTLTITSSPVITVTATPSDFEGQMMISENHTYCAPNPSRGETMNYVVNTARACEVEVKMYTSTHRFVQRFDLHCPGPGKYEHRFYVGNLANGVYLMMVKAQGNDRVEKVVKKVALIK